MTALALVVACGFQVLNAMDVAPSDEAEVSGPAATHSPSVQHPHPAPPDTTSPWTLTGVVVGELGEALVNARISFGEREVLTDERGRFALSFESPPVGDEWVSVFKEGYALKGFPEAFAPGKTTEVRYALVRERIYETRVVGSRLLPAVPDADQTPQVSHHRISRADIDRTPGALEDVARVVQSLPGVAADPDLLANFFVRGGSPDEVIFYIDGVPLSNPYHLGGFASIINPLLIDSADFYAGAAPARYEPALSGVLEVKYAADEVKRVRAVADISMATAKARVDVPLGVDGLSAVVSFRRSYFEAYFEVMKAFKLFGRNVVAPDITEAFARVNYRRGAHRTMATFIHASDGFNFVVKPGEEVLINFAGGLKLSNTSQIASLSHRISLGGDSELSFVGAYTRDENSVNVSSERKFANDASRHEALFRGDFVVAHSAVNRTSAGIQYAWRRLSLTGEVTDTRAVAPWAQEPIVETYRPYLPIAPTLMRNLVSLYGEHTVRPLKWLALDAGTRGQFDASSSQLTGSGRIAAAVTLPTMTVLKISSGLALQPISRPLTLDRSLGNPNLSPERSVQLIAAVEQPLPIEALVRVEGWSKWLSHLVVNPDSMQSLDARLRSGESAFANLGSGRAYGVDGMMVGRARHWAYTLGLGALRSDRSNPLAAGLQTYAVQWEQQFSAAASVSWSPNRQWIATARANFRTGRPYTPVAEFVRNETEGRYEPAFGATSSARFPFYFELSFRGEHRFTAGPIACAVYFELLNVTNTANVFTYMYNKGDFETGAEPARSAFNHLPIRPFLGIRAEY